MNQIIPPARRATPTMPPRSGKTEADLEREALEWCERMGRKLDQKKSRNRPYGGA
jgi:hypothetical protein